MYIMNKKPIMRTAYKVLMNKGYNPKRIKSRNGKPSILFKINGLPMQVSQFGDYIVIYFCVTLLSSRSVDANIEELISRHDFMQLSGIEHNANYQSPLYHISFQFFVFDLKYVQVIIDYAIDTITACIDDILCYVLRN